MKKKVLAAMEAEPKFDKSQNYFDGRVDRIQKSLQKAKRLQQIRVKEGWSEEEFVMANELLGEPTPYGLHATMFLVSITLIPFDESGYLMDIFLAGHTPRTRHTRAAQALPREGGRLRDCWLLCTN